MAVFRPFRGLSTAPLYKELEFEKRVRDPSTVDIDVLALQTALELDRPERLQYLFSERQLYSPVLLSFTALEYAARCGSVASLLSLLQFGMNPNYINRVRGSTPLLQCAYELGTKQGALECARILLDAGAEVNPSYPVLTSIPIDVEDAKTLEIASPLSNAVRLNNIDMVKLLLEYGANPLLSQNGIDAIDTAIETENRSALDLLLQSAKFGNNAERDAFVGSKMLVAAERDAKKTFDVLEQFCGKSREAYAVLDQHGNSLLHLFAKRGNRDSLLATLRSSSLDLNAANSNGETPMFFACVMSKDQLQKRFELIEDMQRAGARIDVTTSNNSTCISALIASGASRSDLRRFILLDVPAIERQLGRKLNTSFLFRDKDHDPTMGIFKKYERPPEHRFTAPVYVDELPKNLLRFHAEFQEKAEE